MYTLSISPNLKQIKDILEQAFTEKQYKDIILQSDQGWQYQQEFIITKGIPVSMSRKGNRTNNGMMDLSFAILKIEMFYGCEKQFKSIKELEEAIVNYIDYYNNKRIKVKLKGLSPVQYRTKSFA